MDCKSCFDRVGVRQRLQRFLTEDSKKPIFAYGDSGVGKSTVINIVAHKQYSAKNVVSYSFQEEQEGLLSFLKSTLHIKKKNNYVYRTLSNIASIKNIQLQLPFVGSISFSPTNTPNQSEDHDKTIKRMSQRTFLNRHKDLEISIRNNIKNLHSKKVQCIWISNLEMASEYELFLVGLIAKHCDGLITCILEGAYSARNARAIIEHYQSIFMGVANFNELFVDNFDERNGNMFFHYKGLQDGCYRYDHVKMRGNPACILYDIGCKIGEKSYSKVITEFIEKDSGNGESLALLALIYGAESSFEKIVWLAEKLDIAVNVELLHSFELIDFTENECFLRHPKLCRFLLVTQRSALNKIVKKMAVFSHDKIDKLAVISCLSYSHCLSEIELKTMLQFGINYAIRNIEKHHYDQARVFVKSIQSISDSIPAEFISQVNVLIHQIESLYQESSICPIISEHSLNGVVTTIISAQSCMKALEYDDCLALTHAAGAMLENLDIDLKTENWLEFCRNHINAAVYISIGKFHNAENCIRILENLAPQISHEANAMWLLLKSFISFPTFAYSEELHKIEEANPFLKNRLLHNEHTGKLFEKANNDDSFRIISKTVFPEIYKSGTVEATYTLNSLAISVLFTKGPLHAIEVFYDLLDICIYEYDYFSAHLNLSICFALTDDIISALLHIKKANSIISKGKLVDPVFIHKLTYNWAILNAIDGDWKPALMLQKERQRFFNETEAHRHNVILHKFEQLSKIIKSKRVPLDIDSELGLEIATIFWPQTLWYWDFSFPIINEEILRQIKGD